MGPLTAALRDLYFAIVRAANENYQQWCTPVFVEQIVSSPAQAIP
jgi:hypothetical protein